MYFFFRKQKMLFEYDNLVYKITKKVCYYVENVSSTKLSALNIKLGFVKKLKVDEKDNKLNHKM